ncbi:hypothetical protein [Flavobacterium luteum]|uniref:Uncharacterized protein n=1 Tax=Flavobacterium luteum TaxID=2026654 RepID=A0A7J5AA44_9FLAO|nr:hypothetical protein [Flavobacterium luteum]KAB1154308.1 hypothetical protein F6464_13060 [Flavobacterium luteum]
MKNLIYLLVLFYAVLLSAQDKKWSLTKRDTIAFHADDYIGFDPFGAQYYIKNNVFIKKTKSQIWQYKNLSFGKISNVDIQNPLNIVLFYEDFNTVILLDNQLNETQRINFSENPIPILATATGLAFGNRLWIYNNLSQQIGLFDFLKSEYKIITTPFNGAILHYSSDYNTFQWVDDQQNWYQCTIFGKTTLLGKVPDFDAVQFISNTDLIYKKGNDLYYYTLNENKTTLIEFDKKSFKKFYYKDQILTIFTVEGITNYKITIP